MANLKNKDISTAGSIDSEIRNLQQFYIPVYEMVGSKRKYYLFDIMPLLLKGNYKGTFGGMSEPQWLTSKDVAKMNFTKKNSDIVVIANSSNDVAHHDNWDAISVKWFDKLVQKSSEAGNNNKKLWLIRTSLFILLNDQQIYNSPALNKVQLGSNDIDTSPNNMRAMLQKYREYTNTDKEDKGKYVILVSREYVKNEMNSAMIQFQTI